MLLAACGGASGPVTVRAEGYSATFATSAVHEVSRQHVGGRAVTISTYVASRGEETDAVATSSLPAAPDPASVAATLARAVTGSATSAGGTVLSHRLFTWLGRRAEDAVIATTNRLVRERVLIVGRELYVIEGISSATPPSFAGYDSLLRTFSLARPPAAA